MSLCMLLFTTFNHLSSLKVRFKQFTQTGSIGRHSLALIAFKPAPLSFFLQWDANEDILNNDSVFLDQIVKVSGVQCCLVHNILPDIKERKSYSELDPSQLDWTH